MVWGACALNFTAISDSGSSFRSVARGHRRWSLQVGMAEGLRDKRERRPMSTACGAVGVPKPVGRCLRIDLPRFAAA